MRSKWARYPNWALPLGGNAAAQRVSGRGFGQCDTGKIHIVVDADTDVLGHLDL